jgi:hypothetical protein
MNVRLLYPLGVFGSQRLKDIIGIVRENPWDLRNYQTIILDHNISP